MEFFTKSICVKQWMVLAMVAMSGFAVGSILAKTMNALGF